MGPGRETKGQNFCQCCRFPALFGDHMDLEIIFAEFPHHLAADAAGRERTFDDAVLAAADSDGYEGAVAVVDRLEESGPLSADGGGEGCVFDIAALIYCTIGAQ